MLFLEALTSDVIEKMTNISDFLKRKELRKECKSMKWIESVLPQTYLYSRKKNPVYGVMVTLNIKTPEAEKQVIESYIRSLSIVRDIPIERNDLMIKILIWGTP
jgi:hypothetical protein